MLHRPSGIEDSYEDCCHEIKHPFEKIGVLNQLAARAEKILFGIKKKIRGQARIRAQRGAKGPHANVVQLSTVDAGAGSTQSTIEKNRTQI